MIYVNVGCGTRFHPDWRNFDLAPRHPSVSRCDLAKGLPLESQSCDVVYHSHVLEHMRRSEALPFIRECFRVLKPDGVMRVVVPDLEGICRAYIRKLEEALAGKSGSEHDYDWMMLELYDQAVREHWDSPMRHYLHQPRVPNPHFVRDRIGKYDEFSEEGRPSAGFMTTLRTRVSKMIWKMARPKIFRAWLLGRFRLSGEIHQWMYDRYSLARLMKAAGFVEPVQQKADTSMIPNWTSFYLDTDTDGAVYKPDSLFMEARKPAR